MQRKSNGAPKNSGQKNAARYALITTATIATVLGAQILAFSDRSSTDISDSANTQQSVDVALDTTNSPSPTLELTATDQPSATPTTVVATVVTTIAPTGTLPPTNTPAATATTIEAASSLDQDKQPVVAVTAVSVQNVASGSTQVTATATTQPTATLKPTSTAVPTKIAATTVKITTAKVQPNPRSKSSR